MRARRSMHQNAPDARAATVVLAAPRTARAAEGPTSAMLAPVQALVAFMSALPAGQHATMFARHGVTIIENFAPYVFTGADAVARWEAGFRAHIAAEQDVELQAEFGTAQDFGIAGDRVYFSLPTTWSGRIAGKPFEERGAWSFVLARAGAGWRVLGYGWGVTACTGRTR